jgi:hypothetical protein
LSASLMMSSRETTCIKQWSLLQYSRRTEHTD